MDKIVLTKKQFLILSYTWGLPLSICGLAVNVILRIFGYKPKVHGYCKYFNIGNSWGGCELGGFFLRDKKSSEHISTHEFGHAIQNCFYGPFMIVLVCIPSVIRYWFRTLIECFGHKPKKEYDDIWFERQASKLGERYIEVIKQKNTPLY